MLAVLFVAAGAHVAAAAPASRAAALAAWQATNADAQVPAGWTGSTSSCAVGAEAPASIAATLRTVNTVRDFAGLAPVSFDPALNHKALAAALMMQAAGSLSHAPGPTWPCYSAEGADGASRSDLFGGRSGAAAMLGYLDDGVGLLGHRRWLLDARAATFGTGSTGRYNALLVIGGGGVPAHPAPAVVAWPPAGWAPWQWVFDSWSITIGTDGQPAAFSTPSVFVAVNGTLVPVQNVQTLTSGYGTGTTVSWQVDVGDALRRADARIDVVVNGATHNGTPFPISYTVSAFQPAPSPPPPDTTRPLLSAFSLSPGSFRAALTGSSIATHGGSRVRYTLSEAARVRFRIQRAVAGRLVGGRCVKGRRSNRHKPRCTRYKALRGSFTLAGAQGPNSFRLSGRLGSHTLPPGRYGLLALATDAAGNRSASKRRSFRIRAR